MLSGFNQRGQDSRHVRIPGNKCPAKPASFLTWLSPGERSPRAVTHQDAHSGAVFYPSGSSRYTFHYIAYLHIRDVNLFFLLIALIFIIFVHNPNL